MSPPSREAAVAVRAATRGDVAAIQRIVAAAYQPYVARIGVQPAPMTADYQALVRDAAVFVAEQASGVVVGVVVLVSSRGQVVLDNVAVAPELHGSGIGGALIRFAEAHAAGAGCAEITLYTNVAMTENRAMYRALGYRETGRRQVDGYDRVFFAKRLSRHAQEPAAAPEHA